MSSVGRIQRTLKNKDVPKGRQKEYSVEVIKNVIMANTALCIIDLILFRPNSKDQAVRDVMCYVNVNVNGGNQQVCMCRRDPEVRMCRRHLTGV